MPDQISLFTRTRLPHWESLKGIAVMSLSFLLLFMPALSVLASPPQNPQKIAASSAQMAGQANVAIANLELGQPIERELAGREVHTYRIALAAGQYGRVVVQGESMDVVVALFGPAGEQIVELDRASVGPELVSILGEPPGNYRLEVRQLKKESGPGRYKVTLAELRLGTPQDLKRAAAEKLYVEATQLFELKTPESTRKTIEKYEEALPLFQAANDMLGEASALSMLGVTCNQQLGESLKAITYYNRELPLRRAAGDRSGEANALNNIGRAYSDISEFQKALDYYNQSLPIRHALGDRNAEGHTLRNLANVHQSLGDYRKALDYLNQALPLLRIAGTRSEEAGLLNAIGNTYAWLMDKRQALDYYHQSLAISRSAGNRLGESIGLNNIGRMYNDLGEREKAITYLQQALQLRRDLGDRLGQSAVLSNLGKLYIDAGEYQKALDYYNLSLPLRRATRDTRGEASTLYDMARVERQRGNLVEALANIEGALNIAESLRTRVASQRLRASYLASVLSYYELKIDLLMGLHRERPAEGFDARALQVSERGHARSLLDLLTEAGTNIRQGVEPALLERERSVQKGLNTKATEQEKLLGGKHTEEQAAAVDREIQTLTSEYEQVQSQIRQQGPRYAALVQPTPLALKEIQQLLDSDTLLLGVFFGP